MTLGAAGFSKCPMRVRVRLRAGGVLSAVSINAAFVSESRLFVEMVGFFMTISLAILSAATYRGERRRHGAGSSPFLDTALDA